MDYREMIRIASDPVAVRNLAALLLLRQHESIERMHGFLSDLKSYDGKKPLTTRQLEALYCLRESTSRRSRAGKYSARDFVRPAFERRHDLNDDDSELWLEELMQRGPDTGLTNGEWRR